MSSAYRTIATVALLWVVTVAAHGAERDAATGLMMTGDWRLVRDNCVACHSAKLITQQRGSADHWLSLIRWMQRTQNLWSFPPDIEHKIVTYLAENYPPGSDRRRAPLPPLLRPPNPYAESGTVAVERAQ